MVPMQCILKLFGELSSGHLSYRECLRKLLHLEYHNNSNLLNVLILLSKLVFYQWHILFSHQRWRNIFHLPLQQVCNKNQRLENLSNRQNYWRTIHVCDHLDFDWWVLLHLQIILGELILMTLLHQLGPKVDWFSLVQQTR